MTEPTVKADKARIAELEQQLSLAKKALDAGYETKFVTPVLPTFTHGGDSWAHNLMAASENLRLLKLMQARAEAAEARVKELEAALEHLLEHTEHKGSACKLLAVGKASALLEGK